MEKNFWIGIVLSFIITAFFDLALNLLPSPIGATSIRGYFNKHTPLAAALIAGFVGAVTFLAIYFVYGKIPEPTVYNMLIIFSISALMGTPMRYSGLFPHLDKHYYQVMPRIQSFAADGLSGIMVAAVYYFLIGKLKPEIALLYAIPTAIAFKPKLIGINV
tara:strand:+ start:30 stop:512 length:483 start_codon:yes stop_codon:yes gene_type:complete